jgi:hypothetical protein
MAYKAIYIYIYIHIRKLRQLHIQTYMYIYMYKCSPSRLQGICGKLKSKSTFRLSALTELTCNRSTVSYDNNGDDDDSNDDEDGDNDDDENHM